MQDMLGCQITEELQATIAQVPALVLLGVRQDFLLIVAADLG